MTLTRTIHAWIAASALIVASPAVAQPGVIVPAQALDQDAPSTGAIAGFCAGHRQQILVDREHLLALRGRQIRSLWMRRDGFFMGGLPATQADLKVWLSETPIRSSAPSEFFAANRGPVVVEVFRGVVSVPAAPPLGDRNVPWSVPHALEIRFSTPLNYVGNNLCIEIEGMPITGGGPCFRPFDFDYEGEPGLVRRFGAGCGVYAVGNGMTASAAAGNMRIGATAVFYSWAQPSTPAFMMIGDSEYSPGLDLSAIGATGCRLYVKELSTLVSVFHDQQIAGQPGVARVSFRLPTNSSLMGSRFWVQWANLETGLPRNQWSNPLGLTTSNGLEVTISSLPPGLGVATVTSHVVLTGQPFPSTGTVNVTRAPVLRFDT